MRVSALLAEAGRTAGAQRVSSLMVAVLCAAICVVTLLTVGRTAAAEEQLLSRLDTAGSRLLVVTDDRDAGLITPAALGVMGGLDTTERVVGVGAPTDVTNAVIGDGGTRVPAWTVTSELEEVVTLLHGRWPQPGEALVSEAARATVGMVHPAGAVRDSAGREYPVVGAYRALPPFEEFDTGVLVAGDQTASSRSAYVVVTSVDTAEITELLVLTVLAPSDLGGITVQSPAALAELQQLLGGDLDTFGRGMLLLVLGGGAFLVAVVVLAEVLLRRRDLGRRRALGAPRWALVSLVVCRTVAAAVPGALIGAGLGVAAAVTWAAAPPADFTVAVMLLTVLVAAISALLPAVLAATRDPVGVLRTP